MIRYANAQDIKQIRDLWELCFPDDSGFNDYFFANLFDLNHVLLFEIEGQIAAMTQMIPRQIHVSAKQTECCTYIYGACTHPEHRRKHLMSQLLERSFMLDRSLGCTASVLIPAEEWLFDFYRQFGYEATFMLNTNEVRKCDSVNCRLSMLDKEAVSDMNDLYERSLKETMSFLLRDQAEWNRQIEMFSAIGMGCFGKHAPDGTLLGYAFAWKPADDMVYVQEVAACSKQVQEEILESIASFANVNRVRYSDMKRSEKPIGCMKRYDNQKISMCYMNLMLN